MGANSTKYIRDEIIKPNKTTNKSRKLEYLILTDRYDYMSVSLMPQYIKRLIYTVNDKTYMLTFKLTDKLLLYIGDIDKEVILQTYDFDMREPKLLNTIKISPSNKYISIPNESI